MAVFARKPTSGVHLADTGAHAGMYRISGQLYMTPREKDWFGAQGTPPEVLLVTRRDHAYLIDAVMVLMHAMEQVPQNDGTNLPELQDLLNRLSGDV